MGRYAIRYLIYRQRIYNLEIGAYWRNMADRGSLRANHFDHVHISFYAATPDLPPIEEDPFMSLTPVQQADLYETTKATNAAVGRLEVQVEGLQAQVEALKAAASKGHEVGRLRGLTGHLSQGVRSEGPGPVGDG